MKSAKDIRIVFMGTPDFAVESLKALVDNGYNIVGVITSPDKPAGRGQKMAMSAVKKYALEQNLHIMQPEKLKNPEFLQELENLKADLQIVVAFRMLPEVVWNMPPMGTFNLHGSLLPRYRGAAPLNWAVMNGDKETGVTTFLLKHEIDTGNIIAQRKVEIGPKDNVGTIHDKLMVTGAQLVVDTVDQLAAGDVEFISQDDLVAKGYELKHAPKIFKNDCLIDWNQTIDNIDNKVRGLSPYPAAWSKLLPTENGKELSFKLYEAQKEEAKTGVAPGTIVTDGKTFAKVACANGWLHLLDLQLAGKKRMKIDALLRGFQQMANYKAQ